MTIEVPKAPRPVSRSGTVSRMTVYAPQARHPVSWREVSLR